MSVRMYIHIFICIYVYIPNKITLLKKGKKRSQVYMYSLKKNLLSKFKFKINPKWYIFILTQVVINLSSQKCILVQNNLDLTLQNKSIKFFSTKIMIRRRCANYKNRCLYKLEHLLFYYYSLAGINYSLIFH